VVERNVNSQLHYQLRGSFVVPGSFPAWLQLEA